MWPTALCYQDFFISLNALVYKKCKCHCLFFLSCFKQWCLILQSENYDTLLGFNVLTYRSCKNLWKSCVEHHTFFRLHSPQTTRGRHFLSLGSKFSYSGRTQCQALEDTRTSHRSFLRSPTKRVIRQTVSWPIELRCFSGDTESEGLFILELSVFIVISICGYTNLEVCLVRCGRNRILTVCCVDVLNFDLLLSWIFFLRWWQASFL